jgi:hypothetical protein
MKKIFSFFIIFLLILSVLIGCPINGEDGTKGVDGDNGLPGAVVLDPSVVIFTDIVSSGDYEADVTKDVNEAETGFNGSGIVVIKFTNIESYSMIINNEVLSNYQLMKNKSVIVILNVLDNKIYFTVDKFEKSDLCATLCVCKKELKVELISYIQ